MGGDPLRVLVVVGPTAAGKSELAEGLAATMPAGLVSADASQVYRGLDIGTAKPTPQQQRRYGYHGIDLRSPTRTCTAGAFARWARHRLRALSAAGKLPILVGGSGFYVQATMAGLDRLPPSRPQFREALQRWSGRVAVHRALTTLDPEWAEELAPNDTQRVLRALEVILRTGRRRAQLRDAREGVGTALKADSLWVGLDWDRQALARRIEIRVDSMLQRGWVDEVGRLLDAGVDRHAHALQAIGYRQLVAHLHGQVALAEAREQIVTATRRYAKRQMTWSRRWPQVRWWKVEHEGDLAAARAAIAAAVRDWCGC